MAGISQKASREEVLPLLARNVLAHGYQSGRRTEFLVLLGRYVHQAKELSALAGATHTIHVSNCEEARPLLAILGYEVRQNCGKPDAQLVTGDQDRAFLTTDSGFPLVQLEQALQGKEPFVYAYPNSQVPVLFSENEWMKSDKETDTHSKDLVEKLLQDRNLAQLYWAFSRTDAETRVSL